jgi:amino acid adenylation domain-containing protein
MADTEINRSVEGRVKQMQTADLKGVRLSIQQARLWSFQKRSSAYRAQVAVLLKGKINKAILAKSLQRIVERHEVLRTTFHLLPDTDIPVQVIAGANSITHICPVISIENLDAPQQCGVLDTIIALLQEEAVNLMDAPLLRTWLLQLSSDSYVLSISLPALCADTPTLTLFIKELLREYTSYHRSEHLVDDDLLQYADVSAWQDELLLEDDAVPQRQYWRDIDLSQIINTPLPYEQEQNGRRYATEIQDGFAPHRLELSLKQTLSRQICKQAQQSNVSTFAWLLTCWQIMLWRLGDVSPFLVGVSCDGRIYEELADAMGLYTRFVPVSSSFEKERSFEQTAISTNRSLQETMKRQAYFTWETVQNKADGGPVPRFFPVSFEYHSWPALFVSDSLIASLYKYESCIEPFILKLSVTQMEERLTLHLHYDSLHFTSHQIGRLAALLETLLHSVVTQPQLPVSALTILKPAEQEHLLTTFRTPIVDIPRYGLHQLFEEQALRVPHQLAVVDSQEQLTYQELNIRANQLARVLRLWKVGANMPVGLCMERSAQMIVGLLAILKAGGAYIPLDPQSPSARLISQLQESQASLLLTQHSLLSNFSTWEGPKLALETIEPETLKEPGDNLPATSTADDVTYIMYTSGSTGTPKGVMIRHGSVVNYTLSLCHILAVKEGWQYATASTLAADLGNTSIFCALASGGCLQVLDYATITSAQAFEQWVTEHPIDVLKIVPSHLSALLGGEQARIVLPRRALILGGEVLPPSLLQRMSELGGSCRVFNHYGPTETTIGVLVNDLGVLGQQAKALEEATGKRGIPLGRPIANSEAYVLDRRQQVVPEGVVGELYIGGAGLATGYWRQVEQTAERFMPHPFSDREGARLYRTGDLACYNTRGQIEFVGRADDQVKLRGYRIEPGEIEVILRRHPQVQDCCVQLRTDGVRAGLVGYIVGQPQPTNEELRRFLLASLPEYMVPSAWVWLNRLPLTANGKLDRRQLPSPEDDAYLQTEEGVPPRNPLEEILLEIWQELLMVRVASIYDNFFQLGGHSLLVTQVLARIRAVLQIDLTIAHFFEAPTIAQLAQRVELAMHEKAGQGREVPPLVSVDRTQPLPLSFAQQRLWFLQQLEPSSSFYNIPIYTRLQGILHVKALHEALQELVRRHEVLRTTFILQEGQPAQYINESLQLDMPIVDIEPLDQKREAAIQSYIAQELQTPFDLAHGPLFHVKLLRCSPQEHILLLTLHHIISDGWSRTILLQELSTFYASFAHGKPSPFAPLSIQYADFSVWQRNWLQGKEMEKQLEYWQRQLAGMPEVLQLPTDYPRPAVQSYRGTRQFIELPVRLMEQLKVFSQQENVTLFMTLLAAFQVVLCRYSAQQDIVVGTPIANRTQSELEGLIGFFANMLAMRTDLSGNPSLREVVQRVRQVCLDAYVHQDVPFEKLVETLQPERSMSYNPLIQIAFSLQQEAVLQEYTFADLNSESLYAQGETTKFDLVLTVVERAHGPVAVFDYNTELFATDTIQHLLTHLHRILEQMVSDPTTHVQSCTLLTEGEQSQLLTAWQSNLHSTTTAPTTCIHHLFEEQVKRTPNAVAVIYEERKITYTDLNHQANQIAYALQSIGVGPGIHVGICLERSPELVSGLLGVLKSGGAYVLIDPDVSQEQLEGRLQAASAHILLTAQSVNKSFLAIEHVHCIDIAHIEQSSPSGDNVYRRVDGEDLAWLFDAAGHYVMLRHRHVCRYLYWLQQQFPTRASDTFLYITSPATYGTTWEILWPLIAGGRLCIAPVTEQSGAASWQQTISTHEVNVMQFTPAMLAELVQTNSTELLPQSLRLILCSGEPLSNEVVTAFMPFFKGEFYYLYNLPETTTYLSVALHQSRLLAEQSIVDESHPANAAVYVLDEQQQPVPVGMVGELYVAGAGIAAGYLNAEEETKQRFVRDLFSLQENAQMFRTGWQARYLNSGTFKLFHSPERRAWAKGYDIHLDEVQGALLTHPLIDDCYITTRQTPGKGQELVSYIVASGAVEQTQWSQQLHTHLPMEIILDACIPVSSLPLTANGKVNERVLATIQEVTPQARMRWEEYLQMQEGVEQAAVVAQERNEPHEVLHLADILPDWTGRSQSRTQEKQSRTPMQNEPLAATRPSRLSINEGGTLNLDAQDIVTLPQALLRAARQQSDARLIYIQSDGSEMTWTYQQLLTEAQRVLAGLRQLDVCPGDRVLMQVEWSQEFLPVLWGCILGGMIPVPASIAPTYEQSTSVSSRLLHAWQMLGEPIVVAGSNLGTSLQTLAAQQGWEHFRVVSFSALQTSNSSDAICYESQPEDPALILLTSGSTGKPKGVMQPHASLLSMVTGMIQSHGFSDQEVTLNWIPLDHVGGLVMFHLRDVYLSCSQIHVPSQVILQDPLKWLDLMDRYRVTITWSPNFAFGLVNDQAQEIKRRHWNLSSLHSIFNGGEAVVAKVARRFLELFQPYGLSPRAMHPAWGMSETSSGIVFSDRFSLTSTSDEDRFVEVGTPIPGTSIRIVDAQDQLVQEGTIGHLQVKGKTLTIGYYQNPEANQEVFHADGWFDTGDLGFLRDGQLTITGRAKEMIILNGVNYYSQEIEAAVEELEEVEHSYTAACTVQFGEQASEELAIFVVSRLPVGQELEVVRKVRTQVNRRVGISPHYVIPVQQEAIPKTAIGKIQRQQLRKELESGVYEEILREVDRQEGNKWTLPAWAYQRSWQRRAISPLELAPLKGVTLILTDSYGVGETVSKQLRQRGTRCVLVEEGEHFERIASEHYRLSPGQEADYSLLGMALEREQVSVRQIIHLWGYGTSSVDEEHGTHLQEGLQRGLLSIVSLTQALARLREQQQAEATEQVRLLVISTQAEGVIEGDEIAYEKAAALGLLKTLPQEVPWLSCLHIDMPVDETITVARCIQQEMRVVQGEPEVAYRRGERYVPRLEQLDWRTEPTQPCPIEPKGFYLLTGGLGGVGFEIAQRLLQHYQAHLLLLGRTPIATPSLLAGRTDEPDTLTERLATLQELARQSGAIHYIAADLCDLTAVQEALQQAQQRWDRPLAGVFHLAGVFQEQSVLETTWERCAAILHPKIQGSWTLQRMLEASPQAFCVSFSSVNAFFGGRRVGIYAAANRSLESWAQAQRERNKRRNYCLSWSMWDEVGMSRGYKLKSFTRANGYLSIEPEQGWSSILTALHRSARTILIGLDESNQHIRRYQQREEVTMWEAVGYVAPGLPNRGEKWPVSWGKQPRNYRLVQQPTLPLTETGTVDVERLGAFKGRNQREPQNALEEQVLLIWRQVLENPQVGVEDSFFDLGGHSLLATQVVARLQRELQVEMPLRSLFEYPTAAAMATAIVQQYAKQVDDATLMQIMEEVKQIADDDLLALLMAEDLVLEEKDRPE